MIIEMGSENWIENSLSRLVGMLNSPQALPEPKLRDDVVDFIGITWIED